MAGLWFEEFEVGRVFDHPLRRTVTETDNLLVSTLTHNPAPLHLDAEYMKGTEYGKILVNSCFTLGLMVGISVNDTTQGTAVANLGWDEVRFPAPIFVGDTLRIESEVLTLALERLAQDESIQLPEGEAGALAKALPDWLPFPDVPPALADLRESRSRPDQGIVTFAHRAYNQHGELVAHCKRSSLQRKRPAANA